jgi:hypothetical protein
MSKHDTFQVICLHAHSPLQNFVGQQPTLRLVIRSLSDATSLSSARDAIMLPVAIFSLLDELTTDKVDSRSMRHFKVTITSITSLDECCHADRLR